MSIEIQQSSEEISKGWWRWSVWLAGPDGELDRVESVTYHLHPTFPQPEREVTDRASGFRLDASGWGTFELGLEIRYASGEVDRRFHELDFSRGPASTSFAIADETADEATDELRTRGGLSERSPPAKKAAAEATDGGPKSILLLHDLEAAKPAAELRRSLEELGISVADASSVAGSSWSKELVDSIRSYDGVVSVGKAERESMSIEAQIAKKLGKEVIEFDPELDDVGRLSRGLARSRRFDV